MDEAGGYALALSIALEVSVDSELIASLLQDDRQVQRDRKVAKRLVGSPTKDTVRIAALLQVEEQAEKDHLLAVRLAGGPDVVRETQGAAATDGGCLNDETYNRLKRYNTKAGNDGKPDGRSDERPDDKLDEKPDGFSTSKKRKNLLHGCWPGRIADSKPYPVARVPTAIKSKAESAYQRSIWQVRLHGNCQWQNLDVRFIGKLTLCA